MSLVGSIGIRVKPGFSGVRVARSLVFCVLFCRSLFVLFLLGIALSLTASVYPFSIGCFFVKLAALKSKSNDWLAQNQDNVFEWRDMSTCLPAMKRLGSVKYNAGIIITSLFLPIFFAKENWVPSTLAVSHTINL